MKVIHDHDYSNAFDEPKPQKPYKRKNSISQQRTLSNIERIAIGIIIICMLFWSTLILASAWALGGMGTMLITLGMLIAYWLALWIGYYVAWRWFWVVTAIGWVIGTLYGCGFMFLVGDITRILIQFIPPMP